jgi:hypothetical protein
MKKNGIWGGRTFREFPRIPSPAVLLVLKTRLS